MADELEHRGRSTGRNALGIAIVSIAVLLGIVYWQHRREEKAEQDLGLSASRVLTAVFTLASDLRVARLTGSVVAKSECESLRFLNNEQRTVAPYAVSYSINLKSITPSDFRWNDRENIMSVSIPEVSVEAANIDMSRARTTQSGIYVSRGCGIAMQRVAATRLAGAAREKARDPVNIAKAREGARAAVIEYVRAPLRAVGYDDMRVVVRLPGESSPVGISTEQWDVSRSIADVLRDEADHFDLR